MSENQILFKAENMRKDELKVKQEQNPVLKTCAQVLVLKCLMGVSLPIIMIPASGIWPNKDIISDKTILIMIA